MKRMRWIEALKAWNAEHNAGRWCVPRKGTAEHEAVRKYMGAAKEPAHERKAPYPVAEKSKPVPKEIQDIAAAGPEANRREVMRLLAEAKKRGASKEKIAKFLKKVVGKHREKKVAAADDRKADLHMSLARSERDLAPLAAELLRADLSPIQRKKVATEVLKLKKVISAIKKEMASL